MNIPSRGKSHLFIGLVDKIKYKKDMLISTFWKDNPSSYYWDVWNTKLIKTDENGVQLGSVSGYGCLCEGKIFYHHLEYETIIGIKYDHKMKNVCFFKNGINQSLFSANQVIYNYLINQFCIEVNMLSHFGNILTETLIY